MNEEKLNYTNYTNNTNDILSKSCHCSNKSVISFFFNNTLGNSQLKNFDNIFTISISDVLNSFCQSQKLPIYFCL